MIIIIIRINHFFYWQYVNSLLKKKLKQDLTLLFRFESL